MSDPLALYPYAIAAGGGTLNGIPARALVAAGLTLLQRSAPLVRALAGKRAAVLVPTGPAFLTALAACEGHGAVLLHPFAAPDVVAHQLRDADVGALFTTSALVAQLPADIPRVLLDEAPRRARVVVPDTTRDVDLGSHVGLSVEGDATAPGRDEEAIILYEPATAGTPLRLALTHRDLLADARATIDELGITSADHTLAALPLADRFALTATLAAPLMAGGRLTALERFDPVLTMELLATQGITQLVGVATDFEALLEMIDRRRLDLRDTPLRVCVCGAEPPPRTLQDRWRDVTGLALRVR